MSEQILDVYTDGSFNGQNASWAFVVVKDDKPIFQQKGVLSGDINSMWQIGGEIKAAEFAVQWAKDNNTKININHDYTGVSLWATGVWRAKNPHTKAYQAFMQENSNYINSYKKVKAHGTDVWNNFVDELAKQ